jgi:hypothetical protein
MEKGKYVFLIVICGIQIKTYASTFCIYVMYRILEHELLRNDLDERKMNEIVKEKCSK